MIERILIMFGVTISLDQGIGSMTCVISQTHSGYVYLVLHE